MDAITWSDIRFFKASEFDSPDLIGSGYQMDLKFVQRLDELRSRVGRPLTINSGFRTALHHRAIYKNKPSIPNSAHLRGLAADIRVLDSSLRFKILQVAFDLNFKRIEVAPRHVHIDVDDTLPQNVCIFLAAY